MDILWSMVYDVSKPSVRIPTTAVFIPYDDAVCKSPTVKNAKLHRKHDTQSIAM